MRYGIKLGTTVATTTQRNMGYLIRIIYIAGITRYLVSLVASYRGNSMHFVIPATTYFGIIYFLSDNLAGARS